MTSKKTTSAKTIKIPRDSFGLKFREHVAREIRKAKKSIKIVTGEGGSYNYFDLRNEAEDAANRGVKIYVYSVWADPDVANRLIHNKMTVYKGNEDPKDHFVIRDDEAVTTSFKEIDRIKPTPMGQRRAEFTEDSRVVAKSSQTFKRLIGKSKKVRMSGKDPLEQALEKPII